MMNLVSSFIQVTLFLKKYSHVKKNNNPVDYWSMWGMWGVLVLQAVSMAWRIASFTGQRRLSSSWLICDCLPAGFICWRCLRKSSPVYQDLYAESCDLIPSNLSKSSRVVSWGRRDVIQWTIESRREVGDWDREREQDIAEEREVLGGCWRKMLICSQSVCFISIYFYLSGFIFEL